MGSSQFRASFGVLVRANGPNCKKVRFNGFMTLRLAPRMSARALRC